MIYFRADGKRPAMRLNNLVTDIQSNSKSFNIVFMIASFKELKNLGLLIFFNAKPLIFYFNYCIMVFFDDINFNWFIITIPNSVRDEICYDLRYPYFIN